MSLYRQLLLAIAGLILILLCGNLILWLHGARDNLHQQLELQAQDTATSLGLTITHAVEIQDRAQIRTFLNVIFDRGFYQRITFRDLRTEEEIRLEAPQDSKFVPEWFARVIDIPSPTGKAEVLSGWERLAEINVVSHPGLAYLDLWRLLWSQLWWSVAAGVVAYALLALALHWLLRPVREVQAQAEAICEGNYSQNSLPSTPELQGPVRAMNILAERVQRALAQQLRLLDKMRKEAHLDPLTGLLDRREFDRNLQSLLDSDVVGAPGVMALLVIEGLAELNRQYGRSVGDSLLQRVAEQIGAEVNLAERGLISRRSGSEFAIFLPATDRESAERLLVQLWTRIDGFRVNGQAEHLKVFVGACFEPELGSKKQLLERTDLVLREAMRLGAGGVYWEEHLPEAPFGATEWKRLLDQALADSELEPYGQAIFADDGVTQLATEVLVRLPHERQVFTGASVLAMAEHLGLAARLDRHMLGLLAHHGRRLPEDDLIINLSPQSLRDEEFIEWMVVFLKEHRWLAKRLILELPERILRAEREVLMDLQQRLSDCRVRLSLENFGLNATYLDNLQYLQLALVKVHRRFVQHLHSSAADRCYVTAILQIASSCGASVWVEGVENLAQWEASQELGVAGGQGYFLARPLPLWQ